jgi:hypothetical protein
MVSQWIGILGTKVWWIACASWSSAGDQGEENGSEGARGGSEEVRVYAMERGKKSLEDFGGETCPEEERI